MAKGNFVSGLQGLMALHQRSADADFANQSRRLALEMQLAMRNASPTGALGNGRLGNIHDICDAGLLNSDGLFLGAYDGRLLFYGEEGHMLTYIRTGGGKGRDLILPNLAHSRDRSLVVNDVKDGENAWASWDHRSNSFGQPCIFLNPFHINGLPNTKINPLRLLVDIVAAGNSIDTEASEIAQILLPPPQKAETDAWVRKGAIRLLSLRMEYLCKFDSEVCDLAGLWRFVNASVEQMSMDFAMMSTCGVDSIERRSASFEGTMLKAPKQFEAYKAEVQEALDPFEPGKALASATAAHEFDLGQLKERPHNVYLMVPSEKVGVAAPWISLVINHAIEVIARRPGNVRCTFLLDEFPQLPAAPAILKALRLYRGKNIQLWFFAQGRFSMEGRWPAEAVKEIEDQAAVTTFKGVSEPGMIRDIQLWSGNTSVLLRGVSHNGGTVETAGANLGEVKRPVLQSEDIMGLGMTRQIIKSSSMPHLVIAHSVPFFHVRPWADQIRDVRDLHSGDA